MVSKIVIFALVLLFSCISAQNYCRELRLDASNSTSDENSLSSLLASFKSSMNSSNPSCAAIAVMIGPGNYTVNEDFILDGYHQTHSLAFIATNHRSPSANETLFIFDNASRLVFHNFSLVSFQGISFIFNSTLSEQSSLEIINSFESSFIDVVFSELQMNSTSQPLINLLNTSKLTIERVSVKSLYSPKFIQIIGQRGENSTACTISNVNFEYNIPTVVTEEYDQALDSYFLSIDSISHIAITNYSISSIQGPSNPLTTYEIRIFSHALSISNAEKASISNVFLKEIVARCYAPFLSANNVSVLLIENVEITENKLILEKAPAVLYFSDVQTLAMNQLVISNTYTQAEGETGNIFKILNPNTIHNSIAFQNISLTDIKSNNTIFFNIQAEFQELTCTDLSVTHAQINNSTIFNIDTHHSDTNSMLYWFKQGRVSSSVFSRLLVKDFEVAASSILNFQHTISNHLFPYVIYGEAVLASLNGVTFSEFSTVSGQDSSLIAFRGVKGIIRRSNFSSIALSQQTLISSEGAASLIIEDILADAIYMPGRSFLIREQTNYDDHNQSQLALARGETANEAGFVDDLNFYRLFSIQNSRFQNINAKYSGVIITGHPFFVLANNTFENITIEITTFLFVDYQLNQIYSFESLHTLIEKNDTFVGKLIDDELSKFTDVIFSKGENFSPVHLVVGNSFTKIYFSRISALLQIQSPFYTDCLIYLGNSFTNMYVISSMAETSLILLTKSSTLYIEENSFINIWNCTLINIEEPTDATLSNNLFSRVGGYGVVTIDGGLANENLVFSRNNITEAIVYGKALISLGITMNVVFQENMFSNCTLSVTVPTALVSLYQSTDIYKQSSVLNFNRNRFLNTAVMMTATDKVPTRSYLIRIEYINHQRNEVDIENCVISSPDAEPAEGLTLMLLNIPYVKVTGLELANYSATLSKYSATLTDFGNFFEIRARRVGFYNCSISGINFKYTEANKASILAIASNSENNSVAFTIASSEFQGIQLNKAALLRIDEVYFARVTMKNSNFSSIQFQEKLFEVSSLKSDVRLADGIFDVSTVMSSHPVVVFAVAGSEGAFELRNSLVELGRSELGTFLKVTGLEAGKISFVDSNIAHSIIKDSTLEGPAMDSGSRKTNTSEVMVHQKRRLEHAHNQVTQKPTRIMRVIALEGKASVRFVNSTIDFSGQATYSPISISTANTSIIMQNSTFNNFSVFPTIANPRAIYKDYFDSDGKHLSGVLSVTVLHDSSEENHSIVLDVEGCSFSNLIFNTTGAISLISQDPSIPVKLWIASSSFQNLSAKYGPALSLLYSHPLPLPASVGIANCKFSSTNATELGGAIFNNLSSTIIENSTFSETVMSSRFHNVIYETASKKRMATLTPVHDFVSGVPKNLVAGVPKYLLYSFEDLNPSDGIKVSNCAIDGSNMLCIHNISSHSLKNFIITLNVHDEDLAPFPDPSLNAYLVVDLNNTNFTFPCSFGTCKIALLDTVLRVSDPKEMNIEFYYHSDNAFLSNFSRLYLRDCIPGEHFDSFTKICEDCPPGKYSLDPRVRCEDCPSNADCRGGSNIEPRIGYWRANTSTDQILKCEYRKTECLGGFYSTCKTGYQGPLCLQCNHSMRYAGSQVKDGCHPCPSSSFLVFLIKFLTWMVFYAYSIYVFYCQKLQNEAMMNDSGLPSTRLELKQALYFDLLTTYSQVMTIVLSFHNGLSDLFMITGGGGGSSLSGLFFPDTCLLFAFGIENECPRCALVFKAVMTPVLEWILLAVFYVVYVYRFKFTRKRIKRILLMGVTFFMLSYPSVWDTLVKFLLCSQLGDPDGDYYISSDPNTSCSTPTYISFRNSFVIPVLVVWIVVIPVIFLISICLFSRHKNSVRQVFGQLMNPYKENRYYWAFGVMLLKLGLILANNITDSDSKFRALSMIMLLYGYKWLEGLLNPYADATVVTAVRFSLYAYLATVFFSLFYEGNTFVMRMLSVCIILAVNAIGLGYILSFIVKRTYSTAKVATKTLIKEKLPRMLSTLSRKETNLSIESDGELQTQSEIFSPVPEGRPASRSIEMQPQKKITLDSSAV